MKNILLCLLLVLSVTILTGQVSKTIYLANAGSLSSELSSEELNSITTLTVTGTIDARDFKTMRDLMPVLAEIDLSGVTILAYEGLYGTSKSGNTIYPSNTVPENAFESKPTLRNIIIPNSTEEISQRAFLYCRQLLSATLPSSLLKINDQAFGWCNSLSSIILPESLTYIGYNAFATTNLSTIYIPESVEYIGDVVFFQCRSLQEINVNTLNIKYCSVEGVLFNKDQTILIAYPDGKTTTEYTIPTGVTKISVRSFEGSKPTKIIIPEGVLHIGFEAFTNMYGLKEINIPASITKIEGGAFAYNQNLTSVSANRIIPLPLYGYGVFDGINKSTCILYVPGGSSELYRNATEWKDFQNIIEYTTYVPDDNFEQALIDLGYDSGPLDDYVLTENINEIKSLTISGKGISDLTGIEDFISLDYLNCMENSISSIDVSKNINLSYLCVYKNKLNTLDISSLPKLDFLILGYNQISSIDLVSNLKLRLLDIGGNPISSIDVSKNPILESLYCNNTGLTVVDVSSNPSLTNLNCSSNNITTLNLSLNTKLRNLTCNSNQLGTLNLANNLELDFLQCSNNLLSYLDLSKNNKLTRLYCNQNLLTSLDVSNCPLLTNFECYSNLLYSLNLKNGNNSSLAGQYKGFNSQNNPNLFCIEVDDPESASNYSEWYKDKVASYSSDCSSFQLTYVPDDNFEQALITLGYDSGTLNDSVPTANINGIINLDVKSKGISDLTGIEDFTSLTTLNCSYNNLLSIDVSKNINLTNFDCTKNRIASVDVSKNANLVTFKCSDNLLTAIDVRKNLALETLVCGANPLTSVDVSQNIKLSGLNISLCNLSSIDVLELLHLSGR